MEPRASSTKSEVGGPEAVCTAPGRTEEEWTALQLQCRQLQLLVSELLVQNEELRARAAPRPLEL